jgi:uncharacterized protein (DUF1697 family)
MPVCVALLRAINVTGRFVKMAALVEHFKSLGYPGASSFINTGNIVLRLPSQPTAAIEAQIQQRLEPLLGFRSEVFLRTNSQLQQVLALAGDLRRDVSPAGEVNVCFLQAPLSEEQKAAVLAARSDIDQFYFSPKHVVWVCQVSQSQSKFSNATLERIIKARATLRRQSTLTELVSVLNGA